MVLAYINYDQCYRDIPLFMGANKEDPPYVGDCGVDGFIAPGLGEGIP